VPEMDAALRQQLVNFVKELRELSLKKLPAVSETIDWARALLLLNVNELDYDWIKKTLNLLLKFQDDVEIVEPEIRNLMNKMNRP
jgi:hypothetical protein